MKTRKAGYSTVKRLQEHGTRSLPSNIVSYRTLGQNSLPNLKFSSKNAELLRLSERTEIVGEAYTNQQCPQ
jgi:hypothetical protein